MNGKLMINSLTILITFNINFNFENIKLKLYHKKLQHISIVR